METRKPSKNYQGSMTDPRNHSANIPHSQNCSVYMTRLSKDLTYAQLLGAIKVGKVYSAYIKGPGQDHDGSAAKIVFWDHYGAEHLMKLIREGRFDINEYKPTIVYNKTKVAAQKGEGSRVIRIKGPERLVNQNYLLNLFQKHFYFNLESISVVQRDTNGSSGLVTVEIRFASYQNQAESAIKVLQGFRERDEIVVWYAEDPCDEAGRKLKEWALSGYGRST